ncbi:MAG: PTS sugar transporter subunit IIA, partial [Pirellulaceae bacterium]|nr:PTS sugar transporter subunit IIA [Pirellulaceae bacterium]
HPTAMENGVALLHPRRPQTSILADPFVSFGRTFQGIPFGDAKGSLTDCFFLICSVDDAGHLKLLARLSRLITLPNFLPRLRDAQTPGEIHDLIRGAEDDLP